MSALAETSIFARSHRLHDGLRVRLRLARPGDRRQLLALIRRLGFTPSEAELEDLLRFAPHRRTMICASALVGGRERIIGFGWVDPRAPRRPGTMLVEPEHAAEVSRLLRHALRVRSKPGASSTG